MTKPHINKLSRYTHNTSYIPDDDKDRYVAYPHLHNFSRATDLFYNSLSISPIPVNTSNLREDVSKTKNYVIGSVEGCLTPLVELVNDILKDPIAKNDTITFLGDYFGTGKDNRKVVEYLRSLQNSKINVSFLKGDVDYSMYKGRYTTLSSEVGTSILNSYIFKNKNGSYAHENLTHILDTPALEKDRLFLNSFLTYKERPNYFLCHGGLTKSRTIEQQTKGSLVFTKAKYALDMETSYGKKLIVTSGVPTGSSKVLLSHGKARLNLNTNPSKTGVVSCGVICDKTGELLDVMYGGK